MTEPKIIIPPPCEPLSLAEAKAQLRLDSDITGDDSLVYGAIAAARRHVENVTRRQLVLTTFRVSLDGFPGSRRLLQAAGGGGGAYAGGQAYGGAVGSAGGIVDNARLDDPAIVLYGGPLQTVLALEYSDAGGDGQTLASDQYTVDNASDPARIMPVTDNDFSGGWPDTELQVNAVDVTYAAGYLVPFTANSASNYITLAAGAAPLDTGAAVQVTAIDGMLPGGLAERTNYYVVTGLGDGALAATPGGSAIDLTTVGTGTLLMDFTAAGGLPATFRQAMKLLVSFFYENRGDATAEIPEAVSVLLTPDKVWRF